MSTRTVQRVDPPSAGEVARQLMNQDVEYLLDVGNGWVQPFVITRADCQQGMEEYGLGNHVMHAPVGLMQLTWVCQAIGAPRRAR